LLTVFPVPSGVAGPELYVKVMYGDNSKGYDVGERWLTALPKAKQANMLADMYLLLLERYPPKGEPPVYDRRIISLSALLKNIMLGMSADEKANTLAVLYLDLLEKYPPEGEPPVYDKRIGFLNTLAMDLMRGKSNADQAAFAATLVDNDPVKLANIVDNLLEQIVGQGSTTRPLMAETWIEIFKYFSAKDIRQTLRGLQDPLLVDQIVELVSADGNDYLSAEETEKWINVFDLESDKLISLLLDIMTVAKAETLIINRLGEYGEPNPTQVAWNELKRIATATDTTDLQRIHKLKSLIVEPPAGPQRQLFTELLTMDIGFAEKFIDSAFPINSQTHQDYLNEIKRIARATGITDLQRIHKLRSLIVEPPAGPQPQLLAELMTMNLGNAKKFIDAVLPADSATHKAWSALIAYKDTLMHINNLKDAYAVLVNLRPYTPDAVDLRSLTDKQQAALIAFIPNTNTAFYLMQAMSSAARQYLFENYTIQAMLILSTEETGDKAQARANARKAILDTLPESHSIRELWSLLSRLTDLYNRRHDDADPKSTAEFYTELVSGSLGRFDMDSGTYIHFSKSIVTLLMSALPPDIAKRVIDLLPMHSIPLIVENILKDEEYDTNNPLNENGLTVEDFLKFTFKSWEEQSFSRRVNSFLEIIESGSMNTAIISKITEVITKILSAEPDLLSGNTFKGIVDAILWMRNPSEILIKTFVKILQKGRRPSITDAMKEWLNQLTPEDIGKFTAHMYNFIAAAGKKYERARDLLDLSLIEMVDDMSPQERESVLSELEGTTRRRLEQFIPRTNY
ncbi:MAG: hypothetical protein AAFZ92_00935, partial [Pseudomonadota bacterium]